MKCTKLILVIFGTVHWKHSVRASRPSFLNSLIDRTLLEHSSLETDCLMKTDEADE